MPSANARACISATPMTGRACTIWSMKSSTTRSTRLWGLCGSRRGGPEPRWLLTVSDNGRGIPTDIHSERRRLGSRSDHDPAPCRRQIRAERLQSIRRTARRRRVGGQCLLRKAGPSVWRSGHEYYMRFAYGDPEAPLRIVGEANGRRGTEVTFLPSSRTFTKTEFDFATIEHRLRELASLNSGVTIVLADLRGVEKKEVTLHYEGGLEAFVRYLDRAKTPLIPSPILLRGERETIVVEAAWSGTTRTMRHALLHQHHSAARRRQHLPASARRSPRVTKYAEGIEPGRRKRRSRLRATIAARV